MNQEITNVDYINRYNFAKGLIKELPRDKSGINSLLIAHKQMLDNYYKLNQQKNDTSIIINNNELEKFIDNVSNEIIKEIASCLQ